jgi:hypothetical protein
VLNGRQSVVTRAVAAEDSSCIHDRHPAISTRSCLGTSTVNMLIRPSTVRRSWRHARRPTWVDRY